LAANAANGSVTPLALAFAADFNGLPMESDVALAQDGTNR
jgi:hypothetical protein